VSLRALGRSLPVADARRVATILGVAGLVLAALGGGLTLLGPRGDEATAIRRRYDGWIVDVEARERAAGAERLVTSMDALARLAERYERMILHERRGDRDAFVVEDDGVAYTYVASAWHGSPVAAR
jgi:hypothetical protein